MAQKTIKMSVDDYYHGHTPLPGKIVKAEVEVTYEGPTIKLELSP